MKRNKKICVEGIEESKSRLIRNKMWLFLHHFVLAAGGGGLMHTTNRFIDQFVQQAVC